MALVLADRVQETTTTTGTGTVTLAGAVTGYQTFAVIGNGNSTFYTIADQGGANWEVGIGTYTSSGTTLSRTTVLASSNSGSLVNFGVGTKAVFVTYPSEKSVNLDASGNVSALGTIASGTWQGSTIQTAYGGTGVTTSTGASSNVLRDANSNVTANNFLAGYNVITAAGGTTVLTVASAYYQRISGSTTQTIQLPNATTLVNGQGFTFDNDSSGTVTIVDNASTTIDTIPSGAYSIIFVEDNSTSAGSWGKYALLPASYDFSTTSANFGGAVISNTTYQGTAVASGYGGTGLTTFTAANNALYSTSSSALAAGTLPVLAGGTGVTTSTGSGSVVLSTSPTLVTPTLGAATGTSLALSISSLTSASSGNLSVGGALSFSDTGITANEVGTTNSYLQSVIQNKSNGSSASAEFIAYNDAGTASTNYATVGINSSTYSGTGSINAAGYGYFLTASTDLVLGTIGNNAIHFAVNSGATDALTISTAGAVTTPNQLTGSTVRASNGIVVNSKTVSANYTIASGDSAMSSGPMTVASGVTVTVSTGSRWVIL